MKKAVKGAKAILIKAISKELNCTDMKEIENMKYRYII